jgi:competence protein ComEC
MQEAQPHQLIRALRFQTDPLLPAAAVLIAGVAIGPQAAWPAGYTLWPISVCLVLWLTGLIFNNTWVNIIRQLLLAAAIFFSGTLLYQVDQNQLAPNDISLAAPSEGHVLITAKMLIVSAPEYHASSPTGPLFSVNQPYTSFNAVVEQSLVAGQWRSVSGTVQVRVPGYLPALKNNEQVQIEGWLQKPLAAQNPGDFDDRQYLARTDIFAEITASDPSQIKIVSDRQALFPISGWLDNFRLAARTQLLSNFENPDGQSYALVALLLGYRDPSIQSMTQDFSNAGAAHLLALSGLHIVIIAAAIWMVLKLFIRRPHYRAAATLTLVMIYVLLTPCGPPVVRAGVGTVWVLLTMMLGRPVRIVNVLAGTAIINVLYEPMDIFGAPFQLSFLVTFALICLADRVHLAIFGAWLARQADILHAGPTAKRQIFYVINKWLTLAFCANLIGALVSFPLIAWHYHQINPLGIINGLILLPIIILVLTAGMVVMTAGLITPVLGHIAAIPTGWLLSLLVWLVSHLAAIPGSNIIVRAPPPMMIILFYAVILIWIFRAILRFSRGGVIGAFLTWLFLLVAWYGIAVSRLPTELWVLDAGSGDALVLEMPDGKNVVIDAGSLGSPQHVADTIDQLLRQSGRWRIGDAIATQIDSAHAGALALLTTGRPKITFYCDAQDLSSADDTYELKHFFGDRNFIGSTFTPLRAGDQISISSNAWINVLWPSDDIPAAQHRIRGCVLLLHLNGRSELILDRTQIGDPVENALQNLTRPDVLILLGPGTLKAGDRAWLNQLKPAMVIACGETQEAAATDSDVLAGEQLLQTGNSGAVDLVSGPDAIHVASWADQ